MAAPSIQGHKLEITVVGCNQLKDTWYGRHKPYVALFYGTESHRTKTSEDGGKNPSFNDKFEFSLIDGLLEIKVHVLSSHHIVDNFIGHGKVNLIEAFSEGLDITTTIVQLESLTGKKAGEVHLKLEYFSIPNANPQQEENSNSYTEVPQPEQEQQQYESFDYMDQELHDARMRMINNQIRRTSQSAEYMGTIGATYHYTYNNNARYGNGLGDIG